MCQVVWWRVYIIHVLPSHAPNHDLCPRALLEAKADLEATQNQGFTSLMLSCQNGHEQCARALLEAKADPNAENDKE